MSYSIEFSKHAYFFIDKYNEKIYLTYIKTADNNVHPRTPNPSLFAIGKGWEIIGEACKMGAHVESGSHKPNNRWGTPEGYIKKWREVLKEALPIEALNPNATLEIAVKKEPFEEYIKNPPSDNDYTYKRIITCMASMEKTEERFFDENLIKFRIHPTTLDNLNTFQDFYSSLNRLMLIFWRTIKYV